jgi:hypothetical protein
MYLILTRLYRDCLSFLVVIIIIIIIIIVVVVVTIIIIIVIIDIIFWSCLTVILTHVLNLEPDIPYTKLNSLPYKNYAAAVWIVDSQWYCHRLCGVQRGLNWHLLRKLKCWIGASMYRKWNARISPAAANVSLSNRFFHCLQSVICLTI